MAVVAAFLTLPQLASKWTDTAVSESSFLSHGCHCCRGFPVTKCSSHASKSCPDEQAADEQAADGAATSNHAARSTPEGADNRS